MTELLSPAGNWDCARAAVAAGADAIYFGLPKFNARLRADNFSEQDLPELMDYLHKHGVKGFIAMNTLIFTSELEAAEQQLRTIAAAGVDALIIQDLGLAKMARTICPEVELHASTQMTITSPEGLAFLESIFPMERAVLSRELSIKEIERFQQSSIPNHQSPITPLEVFVHGALCVAYSGQCLTSESLGQRSANRGECAQACRMPYEIVVDGETRDLGEHRYLLSPQDLAAVDLIPDLIKAGVVSFKIEGRLKTPEYVAAVTRVYRKAIDAVAAPVPGQAVHTPSRGVPEQEKYELEMTFSRGLTTGWLAGTNHPYLTHGKFGKKRGLPRHHHRSPERLDPPGHPPIPANPAPKSRRRHRLRRRGKPRSRARSFYLENRERPHHLPPHLFRHQLRPYPSRSHPLQNRRPRPGIRDPQILAKRQAQAKEDPPPPDPNRPTRPAPEM